MCIFIEIQEPFISPHLLSQEDMNRKTIPISTFLSLYDKIVHFHLSDNAVCLSDIVLALFAILKEIDISHHTYIYQHVTSNPKENVRNTPSSDLFC